MGRQRSLVVSGIAPIGQPHRNLRHFSYHIRFCCQDGIRGCGGGVLEDEVLEPSLPTTVDNPSVKGDPYIL